MFDQQRSEQLRREGERMDAILHHVKHQHCRYCGCWDQDACYEDALGACWWVEPDLCSHCAIERGILTPRQALEIRDGVDGAEQALAAMKEHPNHA